MSQHFHFYSRYGFDFWPDIEKLNPTDITKHQKRFRSGRDVWTVQSYIQLAPILRSKGYTVTAGCNVPNNSIVVAHSDDINQFFSGLYRAFIVGIRADRSTVLSAHIEILQNGLHGESSHQKFIPLWHQPGLIPRNPSRGLRIQKIAYFGRKDSLPPWFSHSDFLSALSQLNIQFDVRSDAWHDYSEVDLLLAHRVEAPTMLLQKPGTKLYNAWLAGVPALLSPEPEYLRLRHSPHDFIDVNSPEDVIAAVKQLLSNPVDYEHMLKQCESRSKEFTDQAIASIWMDFLTGPVIQAYKDWCQSRNPLLDWFKFSRRLLQQKKLSAQFKEQMRQELKAMQAPAPIRGRLGKRAPCYNH